MSRTLEEYTTMLQLKRYSLNTRKSYINAFQNFLVFFSHKKIDDLKKNEIQVYLLKQLEKGTSFPFQNFQINAIKFYYEKILGIKMEKYTQCVYTDVPCKFKRRSILFEKSRC